MLVVRFGAYELDLAAHQLRKRGTRIRLREQPVQVLEKLVENPGEVVTRTELHHLLWPNDVDVDFENNLNTAIGRLREVLGDSASHPRYIETLPRRGYRFIGAVTPTPDATPAVRLLVLPFVNLTGDPAQDYFCDAVTDDLITELAALTPGRLGVIARTTAMRYSRTQKDIKTIGRELDVQHVLEGAVRRQGEEVTLNVQLVRVDDAIHVFGRHYSANVRDLFEVQSRVARRVSEALGVMPQSTDDGSERIAEPPTRDLLAYNEFIQGRHLLASFRPSAFDRAKEHFIGAIARDPHFALAHDSLAELYWWLGYLGFTEPAEAFATGILHAMRAVEIDNTLGETHALLAQYHKQLHYDWAEVSREMARALELSPNSPIVRTRYAINELMPHGRLAEAAAELDRALDLDPLSSYILTLRAIILILSRRHDDAIRASRQLVELDPDAYWGHLVLGSAYRQLHRYDEAVREHRRALEVSGGSAGMMGWLGMSLACAGEAAEARQLLATLAEMRSRTYVPATSLAWIYLGLREHGQAFHWLDRAVEERDQLMMPIKTYEFFDPIRSDARFIALVRKMRLEP